MLEELDMVEMLAALPVRVLGTEDKGVRIEAAVPLAGVLERLPKTVVSERVQGGVVP